jgi:hypothetical protein
MGFAAASYAIGSQYGGNGGSGFGVGHAGGAGGVASKTTAMASGYSVRASVVQIGGSGGYGAGGANGGAGAASTLINAVRGGTTGGYLNLYQRSTGGAGGGSSSGAGGVGGAATSNLDFNDVLANTTHASTVTGIADAYGGAGGNSSTAGGAGGAGTASLTLTGAFTVSATSIATGGAGGIGAVGGKAKATSDAIGTGTSSVTSDATAIGGSGEASAGTASATAIGVGSSGEAKSVALSGSITAGSLVTAASANADAPVVGMSTAKTWAAIGDGKLVAPVLVADQAVAQITAEPAMTDVNRINNYNPNIRSAFTTGKTPTYFGLGELGGAYSTGGSGPETETSSVHMTVDLTKVSPLHDLLIGFYGGTAAGAGFTSMTLDVKVNGTDHDTTFTTVAAANAFFKNNAVDYGALSGPSLQFDISLSITESTVGGYEFGMLIGDPPPASDAAAHHNMVAAMATFGTNASGSSDTFAPVRQDDHHTMLAPHSA